MITESGVKSAIEKIIIYQNHKQLNWAVNYAKAAMVMSGEELRVQVLYILNNIAYWRGEVAKEVRGTLREFIK